MTLSRKLWLQQTQENIRLL